MKRLKNVPIKCTTGKRFHNSQSEIKKIIELPGNTSQKTEATMPLLMYAAPRELSIK